MYVFLSGTSLLHPSGLAQTGKKVLMKQRVEKSQLRAWQAHSPGGHVSMPPALAHVGQRGWSLHATRMENVSAQATWLVAGKSQWRWGC